MAIHLPSSKRCRELAKCAYVHAIPSPHTTQPGDLVRPCFPARMSATRNLPPLVPARVGNVLRVNAVTWQAVKVGEQWLKSWVRVSP